MTGNGQGPGAPGAAGKEPPFEPGAGVAVIGLGRSGTGAARLAHERGAEVYASDVASGEDQRESAAALREDGIDAEAGRHDLGKVLSADLVVVSPGVDPASEVRREVRDAGIRTIAEIELAYRYLGGRIVAITGTNGKTTTTALCGHLLETAGVDAVTAGNIGVPLSEVALREEQPAWTVVELSSFQLADTKRFRPDVGVLLNLAPDHLDRYRNVDRYYADKGRLFANADDDSRWVLNADEPQVLTLANGSAGEHYHFSTERRPTRGAYLDRERNLRLDVPSRRETWARVEDLKLVGRHNVANALAAGLAAALVGCDGEAVGEGLTSFEALPHRLELVARDDRGVSWVNDSKATNVSAAQVAVRAFEEPVVLLMGGRGKGEPYDRLRPLLRGHVRALVAFGEAAPQIVSELSEAVPRVKTESGMDGVVRAAAEMSEPGDVVLFSPACSSYDMFPDYRARGEAFEAAVRRRLGVAEGSST